MKTNFEEPLEKELVAEPLKIEVPQIEAVTEEPVVEETPRRVTAVGITRPNKEESKKNKKIAKASRKKNKQIKNKKRKFSKRPNKKGK